MRKLIVHEFVTLDGIMQAPGGPSYVYNACATGSCPLCRDCLAACLPEEATP
jgi:hypothetical protein